ncbi:MAG: ABC-F family ATP-binding cassette domain-containing protein, partial [Clostridia bacterium]|nr:ABC-F family ATP-binding cassette domain-containing protein [Clostridia bacterium]
MIILGVSDLSVSFGGHSVFSGVTFSVPEGARVGVIGSNGAGKTTLLRAVTGEIEPDAGTVSLARDKTVGLLDQTTRLGALSDVTLVGYVEAAFPELLAAERELDEVEREIGRAAEAGQHDRAAALSARYGSLSARFEAMGGRTFRARCRSMLGHLGFDATTWDR